MSPDSRKVSYGTPEYPRNLLEKGKTPNIIDCFSAALVSISSLIFGTAFCLRCGGAGPEKLENKMDQLGRYDKFQDTYFSHTTKSGLDFA